MENQKISSGVKELTCWWIKERQKKLKEQLSETMTVNPFLMPFFMEFHGLEKFEELVNLMVASHLVIGHNTGFGKLVDEKILPQVFGTTKLDANYRKKNVPFANSAFDEIDHIVWREDGLPALLSVKAGKWTIQLSMARQLNNAFHEILKYYPSSAEQIVVGVMYGNSEDLTDKYDLIRGINRGANHHLHDLQSKVSIYSGNNFWDWLGRAKNVQSSVLQGILDALRESDITHENQTYLQAFRDQISSKYDAWSRNSKGDRDWQTFLKNVNKGK